MNNLEKGLFIISTPIGNLEDISLRAKKILHMVDFIVCENPIHSLKLLNKFGIKKKLYSLHDYNEKSLIKRIEKHQKNSSIALISDAGSPLISDPGYNLVLDYIDKNLPITTLPGPSSVISALQLSGFPINNFKFFGFIPKNQGALMPFIKKIADQDSASVIFVSGRRLLNFLETFLSCNIDKSIAICKEITKKNEKVFRGDIKNIIEEITSDIKNFKGEFVVVISGNQKKYQKTIDDTIKVQMKYLLNKFSLTEVVEIVHKLTNVSKKEIYKAALMVKDG